MKDQLTIERTEATVAEQGPATVKTILLHVQNDTNLEARLQVALALARAAGAHVKCLHVTPIEAYVTMDSFGGLFVMDALMQRIDEEEAQIRAILERRLQVEDVTWDYEQVTAETVGQVVRRAALSDMVITGREPHLGRARGLEISILGDIVTRITSPVLIPGDAKAPFDPFGTAAIAWNGSYEAANAVRSAVGLLKLASNVNVARVSEGKDEQFPSTVLLEYLSRHGIHAELDTLATEGELIADRLVGYATAKRANYMVMGAYGHSRAGEYLFGGVTRSLLKECPVALVVAH
jgi:nucleotide-binding universal stress UspA family protein